MSYHLQQFTKETHQRLLAEANEKKSAFVLYVLSPYEARQQEYFSQAIGYSYDAAKVEVDILPLPRPGLNCMFEVHSTIKLTSV